MSRRLPLACAPLDRDGQTRASSLVIDHICRGSDRKKGEYQMSESFDFSPNRFTLPCLFSFQYDHAHVKALAQRLKDNILSQVDEVLVNGDPDHKYEGCLNLSFSFVEGESLLMALKDICLSSGSACTSASLEPSYVLRALGLADENAHSSLRFGIGRFTTVEEIDYVSEKIVAVVNKLRDMSPLWELHQDGVDLTTIEWAH